MLQDINTELIEWVLDNHDITAYRISKDSGISQQALSKYRSADYDIDNMTLKTAKALTKAAYTYYNEDVQKAVQFINGVSLVDGPSMAFIDVQSVGDFERDLENDLHALQNDEDDIRYSFDENEIKSFLNRDWSIYDNHNVLIVETDPANGDETYAVPFNHDDVQRLAYEASGLNGSDKQILKDVANLLPNY